MMRIITRLVLQGVRDLGLNPWAQLLTLAAVSLVAFLSGLFLMALVTVNHQLGTIRGETAFQLYWKQDAPPEQITEQWESMKHLPGFVRIRGYTPDQALQSLGERLGQRGGGLVKEFPYLAQNNPLPYTALVTFEPKDEDFDSWLNDVVRHLRGLPGVERLVATPLRDELGQAWRKISHYVMWPTVGFLCMVLALVVGNTIRLSLLARTQEIEILKLIGAFSWYIRLPLMVSGAIQGMLGGAFALSLLHGVHGQIRHVLDFPPLLVEIQFLPWQLSVLLVAVPMCMGIIGSWLAVRE